MSLMSQASRFSVPPLVHPVSRSKDIGGLNSSVTECPAGRGFPSYTCESSGMWWTLLACSSLACSSSCAEPPLPQALSAKTRSVPSSPTTSSAAHALRLLTLVMPIFPSPHCCGRERALSAAPPGVGRYMGTILPYGGQTYHSNGLSLVLLRRCLRAD